MMKRMSRYCLLLALAMFLLTACGGSADRDGISESDQEQNQEEISTEASLQTRAEMNSSDDSSEKKPQEKSQDDLSSYVRLMPNVTVDMLSADYWLNQAEDVDQVVMDQDEIKNFNEDLLWEKAERNKFLALEQSDREVISGELLTKYLDESEQISDAIFENGESISQDYWDDLIKNENYSAIKDENPIHFGFVTERASVKQFPTNDVISTGDQFTFFDENQIATTLLGEAVIVIHDSEDGSWYFILTETFGGWISKDYIALTKDKDSWKEKRNPEHFLTVVQDRFTLEYDPEDPDISQKELTMGCRFELLPYDEYEESQEGREAYGNYVISVPVRDNKGYVDWKKAYVPLSRGVHVGYLPYTRRNVIELAFDMLGNRYGWGGMYKGRDCSQYIMEIYRCFGMILPRNSTGLSLMNSRTYDMEDMGNEEKENILDTLPKGSILYMQGHVMIYLGKAEDKYYVISSSASSIPEGDDIVNAHSVLVNELGIKRKNGKSWLENIECAKSVEE